jgi:hypothetical protein
MAESPYSEKRHLKMTLPEMLAILPPAWLERYEETQRVKPRELLAKYKKVEGKKYGLRILFQLLIGLVSAVLICLLLQHNNPRGEDFVKNISNLILTLPIILLTWWWMNHSTNKEVARLDLVHQMNVIGDTIETLIKLVGGERWLNDHGIKTCLIRLAGDAVVQEEFLIKIAKKVGDGDLDLVYKIQTCVGNLNSKERAYERATNLISCFVNPPFNFDEAKRLAREVMEIGEPDVADEQPLT